jgi:hypothetical protein
MRLIGFAIYVGIGAMLHALFIGPHFDWSSASTMTRLSSSSTPTSMPRWRDTNDATSTRCSEDTLRCGKLRLPGQAWR